jgi:hypothetical protein
MAMQKVAQAEQKLTMLENKIQPAMTSPNREIIRAVQLSRYTENDKY